MASTEIMSQAVEDDGLAWKMESGNRIHVPAGMTLSLRESNSQTSGATLDQEFLSNSGLRRDFSPVGTDIIDKRRVLPSWNRQAALSHRISLYYWRWLCVRRRLCNCQSDEQKYRRNDSMDE